MNRRSFFAALAATVGAVLVGARGTDASPGARRRQRRRVRRRVRRRIRRRVAFRAIRGRPFWVVPVATVVGWELVHRDRVVVVDEIRHVEADGEKTEVVVVRDSDGKTEEIAILREDTKENRKDLGGSELPPDDKTTPGAEAEVEVEEDEKGGS